MTSDELDFKQIFLEEATQLLDDAEGAFMELDQGNQSRELLEKIFRLAHNFKGSAMAVGFEQLSRFAHQLEDAISWVKAGRREADRPFCTVMLQALDTLKAYIQGLKGNDQFTLDTREIEAAFRGLMTEGAQLSAEVDSLTAVDDSSQKANTQIARPSESVQEGSPEKTREQESLRVSTQKLDTLLNLVGEMVVNQSIITGHRVRGTTGCDQAIQTLAYLEKIVFEIQNLSMSLRMLPIKPIFQKMSRIVRDISVSQAKEVELLLEGEHVELDKLILERIVDPLTHLVRNAVDHGLENPDDRVALGKPRRGRIYLQAQQRDEQILITLRDDGRGMDAEKLIRKAQEKGLLRPDEKLTPEQAYALIFRSGFSTKEQVTDISGRGVGMDVVQKAVEALKGSIRIETQVGQGTSFLIALPLSLSIISGMVFNLDNRKYVVPVSQLVEIIEYGKLSVHASGPNGKMLNLRGEVIPMIPLGKLLHTQRAYSSPPNSPSGVSQKKTPGLVVYSNGKKVSFEVDEILGQQQIVIKKLGPEIDGLPGILGGAVLSNGEASLILDLNELYRSHYGQSHAAA